VLYQIKSLKQTKDLAAKIALAAKIGDVYGLKGTLGAGKSFFASSFINALSDKKVKILSPTFNLLYSYQTTIGDVHHLDLYRLKNFQELENIGFFDCLKNGICLVEWPEIVEKLLFKNYIEIDIRNVSDKGRLITIK
jgi:tRNA threonylcarbamoyl adenosine modification protein YjeE